jgi:hypothetical protein
MARINQVSWCILLFALNIKASGIRLVVVPSAAIHDYHWLFQSHYLHKHKFDDVVLSSDQHTDW